jgi:hypothetical protein
MSRPTCTATTLKGTPCCLHPAPGNPVCHVHERKPECSICLCDIDPRTKYNVGCPGNHVFHTRCINTWFVNNKISCPLCRAKIQSPLIEEYRDPVLLDNFLGILNFYSDIISRNHMVIFDMDHEYQLLDISYVPRPSPRHVACFSLLGTPHMYFLNNDTVLHSVG